MKFSLRFSSLPFFIFYPEHFNSLEFDIFVFLGFLFYIFLIESFHIVHVVEFFLSVLRKWVFCVFLSFGFVGSQMDDFHFLAHAVASACSFSNFLFLVNFFELNGFSLFLDLLVLPLGLFVTHEAFFELKDFFYAGCSVEECSIHILVVQTTGQVVSYLDHVVQFVLNEHQLLEYIGIVTISGL